MKDVIYIDGLAPAKCARFFFNKGNIHIGGTLRCPQVPHFGPKKNVKSWRCEVPLAG